MSSQTPEACVSWRRLDEPGHDWAQLVLGPTGVRLSGVALFSHEGAPCRMDYVVLCAPDGRTRSAAVSGFFGRRPVRQAVSVDDGGGFSVDGVEAPALAGCVDVDLSFTPATNLLPLRRLALEIGQSADLRSAWLLFPELTWAPLIQRYRRLDERRYAYESTSPVAFAAELEVAPSGFVTTYPGLWQAEAISRP